LCLGVTGRAEIKFSLMDRPRVIVAHKLAYYREAIARALREVRPQAEVIEIEPEDLDREVGRLAPKMVICSRATPAVRRIAPSWVELYREHDASLSCVSVVGEPSRVVGDLRLEDLLSIIDRTLRVQPG
jgi:hypothetical protein